MQIDGDNDSVNDPERDELYLAFLNSTDLNVCQSTNIGGSVREVGGFNVAAGPFEVSQQSETSVIDSDRGGARGIY